MNAKRVAYYLSIIVSSYHYPSFPPAGQGPLTPPSEHSPCRDGTWIEMFICN